MRPSLILSIFALTALVFFFAVQTLATPSDTPQLETLQAQFDSERATLTTQVADAQTEAAQSARDLDQSNQQLTALASENVALSDALAAAQSDLDSLENATGDTKAVLDTLNAEIDAGQQQVETLQATIADLQTERDGYITRVAELESNSTIPADEVAALQDAILEKNDAMDAALFDITELEEKAAIFAGEVATLTNTLAQRDAEIAALQTSPDQPVSDQSDSPLLICQNRITTALDGNSVAFENGSSTISVAAIPLLETIADIAIDCTDQGLSLDIEGHTNGDGGSASNLLLSNGRATEVESFLAGRGVPTTAMRAAGYGGTDPIADNSTDEGRAQNQRVAFNWKRS